MIQSREDVIDRNYGVIISKCILTKLNDDWLQEQMFLLIKDYEKKIREKSPAKGPVFYDGWAIDLHSK